MFSPVQRLSTRITVSLILFIFFGCASYYAKNIRFYRYFEEGEIEKANDLLTKQQDAAKGKNRLLYFLHKGVVLQMLEQYEQSNIFFEQAYIYSEDYHKNYALEALSLISNPEVIPYRGEDFEAVLIHYYKALNFLRTGMFDEALVECRRINIRLNEINDRYSNKKNRYKTDAFALNLMGIIYEASGEINDAFIAYRNAYEAYREVYQLFNVAVPQQLKIDLLRSAYLNGFTEELKQYEDAFGLHYAHQPRQGGELIFFWNNGLGPVKDEFSINFVLIKGEGGVVVFENEEYGWSFPFILKDDESSKLGDLKVVRMALPKYVERRPYYTHAELIGGDHHYPLETAQNINEIAFKTLEDRMLRELATSLLRVALKQAGEEALRRKNEDLGALLSITNALTEKADTRNWQTLPYSISYARIPLSEGENQFSLKIYSPSEGERTMEGFSFTVRKGETVFYMFHTLDSYRAAPFQYAD